MLRGLTYAGLICLLAAMLAGCNLSSTSGNSSVDDNGTEFGATGDATTLSAQGTYPLFSPTRSEVPLMSDFLFAKAATTDGTFETGAYLTTGSSSVTEAIDDLDGISTNAAIDFKISGSVAEASVLANMTVFLIPLQKFANVDSLDLAAIGTASGGVFIDAPQAAITAFEVRVVDIDGGTDNLIRILPTKPLRGRTKYLAVLTNGITTTGGTPLVPSPDYSFLKGTDTLYDNGLVAARSAVQAWDQIARGFLAANSVTNTPVMTQTFTTTDPQVVLKSMAEPTSFNPAFAALPKPGSIAAEIEMLPTGLPANLLNAAFSGDVFVYQGAVKLPSYYSLPTDTDPAALATIWEANIGLSAALKPDIDGFYNVTYRFPIAKKVADDIAPLLVIYNPNCAVQFGTIIYQHGITANRLSAIAMGVTMANPALFSNVGCYATVAIDLPGHGIAPIANDRNGQDAVNSGQQQLRLAPNVDASTTPFAYAAELTASANPNSLFNNIRERHKNWHLTSSQTLTPMDFIGTAATDLVGESGSYFINLTNFQRTRDNLRQAVMDLLHLNAALDELSVIDLNGTAANGNISTSNVHFLGHSLGAIVGIPFVAVNNAVSCDHDGTSPCNANLPNIDNAVFTNPGGQITKLLENSASFSPVLLSGLASNGLSQGTKNLESFLTSFQSTIDSVDPVNFVDLLFTNTGKPITSSMMIEQKGGQSISVIADRSRLSDLYSLGASPIFLSDLVVPINTTDPQVFSLSSLAVVDRPETAYSPLGGFAGLTGSISTLPPNYSATSAAPFDFSSGGVLQMGAGTHSTFSSNDALEAFTEMAIEVGQFLVNPASVSAINTAVLAP